MSLIIAYAIMFFDHGLRFFAPTVHQIPMVQAVGAVGWSLFAWGIADGFRRTSDVSLYSARLLIVALVSQAPYFFLFGTYPNPVFALWFGLACIMMSKRYGDLWAVPWLALSVLSGAHFIITLAVWWSWKFRFDVLAWLVFWSAWAALVSPFQFIGIAFLLVVLGVDRIKVNLPRKVKYAIYPAHFFIILLFQKIIM